MAAPLETIDRITTNMMQLGDSAQAVANEVRNLRELPAFDHGQAILEEIRALRVIVESGFQRVNKRLDASEHNATARMSNYAIAREVTAALTPLRSPEDEDVPGIPRTVGDIEHLSVAQVRQLLRAYGLPEGGNPDEKKVRLKRHMGVYYF